MRLSIRNQLAVPMLLLIGGLLGGGWWLATRTARAAALEQADSQARAVAKVLQQSSYPLTDSVLTQVSDFAGFALYLRDPDGGWRQAEGRPAIDAALLQTVPIEPTADRLTLATVVATGGPPYRAAALPIARRDRWEGTLYLLLPAAAIDQAATAGIATTATAALLGAVLSLLAVLLIARRLTGRLARLVVRTRAIACGDDVPSPPSRWHDEISDLNAALTQTAAQLHEYQEALRRTERLRLLDQVSSGLAHQIRNGLAGIKLAIQAHQREQQAPAARKADASEALAVALRELRLLEERLTDFLSDERKATATRVCDLAALAQTAVELLTPRCRHQKIQLLSESSSVRSQVAGSPQALLQVLINLLDNGIQAVAGAGSESGTVRVAVRPGAAVGTVTLTVADTGPGPPPAVADRLFEPFVTGRPDGVGLGLAVVHRVVQQLGGTLAWRREDNQTIFTVTLQEAGADDRSEPGDVAGCADH